MKVFNTKTFSAVQLTGALGLNQKIYLNLTFRSKVYAQKLILT